MAVCDLLGQYRVVGNGVPVNLIMSAAWVFEVHLKDLAVPLHL